MTGARKAATFQLCQECGQPYSTTPTNTSGFCSWDCFDVKPRPDADPAEVFHGFLGPGVTMTRIDEPGDEPPPFEVKRLQTYVPCSTLNWQRSKPFIVDLVDGDRIRVWDPTGGQRMGGYRWVARRNLHPTSTTGRGKERTTGFYLRCEPPAKGQELCGYCFMWLDPEKMAVLAHGYGHSTCKECKIEIEKLYGRTS